MDTIARWVVLGLGRLTFAALRGFEKLGVNMAREDEVIAQWTDWSNSIKAQLADALSDAQTLRDTDAAEDAAQANAQSEALADKLQAAFDSVSAPPVAPQDPDSPGAVIDDPSIPGPPNDPPSTDAPVEDTPVVVDEPVEDTNPPVTENP